MLRVLVVDDTDDLCEALALLLRAWGFEPRVAADGPAALAAAASFRPQAAVLDIDLPGTDGWEVGRRLREGHGPGLLLVALTGHAGHPARCRSREAGLDAHLTKPCDLRTLRSLLAPHAGRTASAVGEDGRRMAS